MPTFTNISNLSNYIRQQTVEIIRSKIGEEIKEILHRYVDTLLYKAQGNINGDSSYNRYHRTYQLIDSITVSNVRKVDKNTHEIKIFFDSQKIIPTKDETSKWNQHMSSDGTFTEENEHIASWMNYGHAGMYNQRPLLFLEEALKEINSKEPHIKILEGHLKAKGFTIV
jgi:hypothetical protein